jgi:hypothetical protein
MRIKIKQIAHLFKVFNPKIHEYVDEGGSMGYIMIKSLKYIVEFVNKDVYNYDPWEKKKILKNLTKK